MFDARVILVTMELAYKVIKENREIMGQRAKRENYNLSQK
jgi:hypothetical protein